MEWCIRSGLVWRTFAVLCVFIVLNLVRFAIRFAWLLLEHFPWTGHVVVSCFLRRVLLSFVRFWRRDDSLRYGFAFVVSGEDCLRGA